MSERQACSRCETMVLINILESNHGVCLRCTKNDKRQERVKASSVDQTTEPEWELCRDNASTISVKLLTDSIFWDQTSDYSPLGSDTGSDILAFYREWRDFNRFKNTKDFIKKVIVSWDLSDSDWTCPSVTQDDLKKDHYRIIVRDDFMIALAFAQLVIDGKIIRLVYERAITAIQRQSSGVMVDFRGWDSPDIRLKHLTVMRKSLEGYQNQFV